MHSSHLFNGSYGRRARSDSLPDPGIVVHGPERELQDAPEQWIGEIHAAAHRVFAVPAVRRAEEAHEYLRCPGTKRRASAMTKGAQHEQTFVRPEEITRPAAGEAHVP